jgi:hypothetical protein
VQHYAEATTLCRHVAICRYFGEKIDEANPVTAKNYCDNMCDVSSRSKRRGSLIIIDFELLIGLRQSGESCYSCKTAYS